MSVLINFDEIKDDKNMANQTITTHLTESEFDLKLYDSISNAFKTEVAMLMQPNEPIKEILTRQETAGLLSISLPTLHDYTKRGLIQAHRLGFKVRYKRADVINALNVIKVK